MFSAVLLTTAMGLGQPVPPPVVILAPPIHHPPGVNFVTEPNYIKVKVIPGAQTGAGCAAPAGAPPVGAVPGDAAPVSAPPVVVFDPYLYPTVPSPVVIAHPNWYRWPGPAYWYKNNVTPYNAVYHKPLPPEKKKEDPKKTKN